jgi:hypothetical protein
MSSDDESSGGEGGRSSAPAAPATSVVPVNTATLNAPIWVVTIPVGAPKGGGLGGWRVG